MTDPHVSLKLLPYPYRQASIARIAFLAAAGLLAEKPFLQAT
jgi:hypothetical protein